MINKELKKDRTLAIKKFKMSSSKTGSLALVWLALIIIQLGFGAYGVIVAKYARNNNADPLIFSMYRDGGCFPVLFLVALISERKIEMPNKRDLPVLVALGVTGMFLNQLFYILGVYYTSADIASMLQPLVPVWTSIIAVVVKVEKIPNIMKLNGCLKVLGVLLAVAGAIIATFGMKMEHEKQKETVNDNSSGMLSFGYICLLINTFSTGLYAIIQKKFVFNKESSKWKDLPINLTAWSYLFGFIVMALASLYYVANGEIEKFSSINGASVLPLIYAVFISSALNYMLITWCNMQVSSTVVTAFWPLQVLFCVILAYFMLGEVLSAIEIIGGLLIIFALLAVVFSNYREERDKLDDSEIEHDRLINE